MRLCTAEDLARARARARGRRSARRLPQDGGRRASPPDFESKQSLSIFGALHVRVPERACSLVRSFVRSFVRSTCEILVFNAYPLTEIDRVSLAVQAPPVCRPSHMGGRRDWGALGARKLQD